MVNVGLPCCQGDTHFVVGVCSGEQIDNRLSSARGWGWTPLSVGTHRYCSDPPLDRRHQVVTRRKRRLLRSTSAAFNHPSSMKTLGRVRLEERLRLPQPTLHLTDQNLMASLLHLVNDTSAPCVLGASSHTPHARHATTPPNLGSGARTR